MPHSSLGAKLESIIVLGQHTFLTEKKEHSSYILWANEFLVPNRVQTTASVTVCFNTE